MTDELKNKIKNYIDLKKDNVNSLIDIVKNDVSKINILKDKLSLVEFKDLINFLINKELLPSFMENLLLNRNDIYQIKDTEELFYLYFINLTLKEQMKLIELNSKSIVFLNIDNDLLKLSIKADAHIINHFYEINWHYNLQNNFIKMFKLKEISKELLMLAIFSGNKSAIEHLSTVDISNEEETLLIERYGIKIIKHLKSPSLKLMKKALNENPSIFEFIANKCDYKFKIYAVKQFGYVIQWIKDPSEELIQLSLIQSINNFKHVLQKIENKPDIRENVLKTAVGLDATLIKKIPKKYHTIAIAKIVLTKNEYLIRDINFVILNQLVNDLEF